jgi:hypothetical protein
MSQISVYREKYRSRMTVHGKLAAEIQADISDLCDYAEAAESRALTLERQHAARQRRMAELETKLSEENIAWLQLDGRWARAIRWAWRWRKEERHWHGYARHLKDTIIPEIAEDTATLARELGAARQRADDMREALASFGRHDDGCPGLMLSPHYPCTCGLAAAIAAGEDGQ